MRILRTILKGVLPLVLLGLAALAAVTMIRNRPVVETQPPQIAPPGVRVHVVEIDDVDLSVISEGTVRPRTESELVPEISGRVMSISPSFAEGGFFEQGDILVTIDPFDYQQAMISARAQLAETRLRLAEEEAEAEVARREWEDLGRGDPRELTLRKPQLENARAAVAAAEANVVRSQRDLERAEVTAPYAGRVRRKNVDIGQFVTIGNSIGTIYAVDVAEIRLPLPDQELAYLNLPLAYQGTGDRRGPRVTIRTTFAGEEYAWNGRIVRTEGEIDPVSRMVHVVAEVHDPYLPGPDLDRPPLAVGMYVDAEIEGRRFDHIAVVPRAALRGRDQVMVIDDQNRLRFREVDILRTTAELIYVAQGLEGGERVVISTIDSPTDGMRVQVAGDSNERRARRGTETPESVPEPVRPRPITPNVADARSEPRAIDDDRQHRASEPRTSDSVVPSPASTASAPRVIDAQSVSAAPNAVAVLSFTDLSPQAADINLGAVLAQSVSERLDRIGAVWVVPAASTASWVVGGTVQQQDDAVRVTVHVVETDEGKIVDTIRLDWTATELARIREDVASVIAARLVESLGDAVTEPFPDPDPDPVAAPSRMPPTRVAEVVPDPVPPTSRAATRVAVRPFANLSREPDDDTLAVGIGDAIAAYLAEGETSIIVASEDDAEWVVSGGIQRVGVTVRITARLVDVHEGSVVRAVKIDGPVTELVRLQEEVALAMSRSLREAVGVAK